MIDRSDPVSNTRIEVRIQRALALARFASEGVPRVVVTITDGAGVGEAVKINGSLTAARAQADAVANAAIGIIQSKNATTAVVVWEGVVSGYVGLTIDALYYLDPTTPGAITTTAPSGAGQIVQVLGRAVSATQLAVNVEAPSSTSSAASVATTFVFRPGGVAGGNVYTSWAALVAQCVLVAGPRIVEIDTSLGVATLTAATLGSAADVTIRGYGGASFAQAAVSITGALAGVGAYEDLSIAWSGATACNTQSATRGITKLSNVTLATTGAGDFVRSPAGVVGYVLLTNECFILSPTAAGIPFNCVGAGAFLTVTCLGTSFLQANVMEQSAGGTTAPVVDATSIVNHVQNSILVSAWVNYIYPANTLVVNPAAVSSNSTNIFATLAQAALFRRSIAGPVTIEFAAATVVPAGAYDLRDPNGLWNTTLKGVAVGGAIATAVTLQDGVTIQGVNTLDDIAITSQTTATAVMTATASVQTLFMRNAASVNQTGGGTFWRAPAGIVAAAILVDLVQVSGTAGSVLDATGGTMIVQIYDQVSFGTRSLSESAGGSAQVQQLSTMAAVNLTQPGMTINPMVYGGGKLGSARANTGWPGFSSSGNNTKSNVAITDASSTVAPAPANQTGDTTTRDVLVAVVTPVGTGFFRVQAFLNFTATATNTVTVTVRTRTRTAALVPANATATGLNCFFATADGSITYGAGALTNSTKDTSVFAIIAGLLTWEYSWSGVVAAGGAQAGFPTPTAANANNVAIAITVADTANSVTGMTGSLSVEEVLIG